MPDPSRRPPRDVLRELRQEVGFCCPVEDCGNPYLTWHHFDPPWRVEHHHRPEGMIALCREHADKADNGSFSDDQLRELKRVGRERAPTVCGRFDWMRNDLLAVVGGNFYYQNEVILQIGSVKCIWFNRDDDSNLLLNFRMPTLTNRPRASIEENVWTVLPAVNEVICPPNGRIVEVDYGNGDRFRAEFLTIESADQLDQRYAGRRVGDWAGQLTYPLTVVELCETAAGTALDLQPGMTQVMSNMFSDCFVQGSTIAFNIGASPAETALLFPDLAD